MRWHSPKSPPKRERAVLLALALASLLLRAGEHVRLLGAAPHPAAGRQALLAVATLLSQEAVRESPLPPAARPPRHARLVLIGDFLDPLEHLRAAMAPFAAIPVASHILQILDPAEADLPFRGRVRFEGVRGARGILVPRVEDIRAQYRQRLEAHIGGIAAIATAAGGRAGFHRTDHAPGSALLALYEALAQR